MSKSLDFELVMLGLEHFIKDQSELAECWRDISLTACEDTYFWANLVQIFLEKYIRTGNSVELILNIMEIDDKYYGDLVMQYLFDQGLAYEIMELLDDSGQTLFE